MTMTIAEQVAEHHQASAGLLPADVAKAFTAEQRELATAGRPGATAAPGDRMPDGSLLDVAGQPTTLAQALGSRPGVIVFYRGGWCPYCNIALRAYQAQLVPALAEQGIPLAAISPQTPDGSLSTQEAKELTFTVLSDLGNQIAGELGILTAPPMARVLPSCSSVSTSPRSILTAPPLPMPAVVDAEGVIRWIGVHADYTTRTEPAEVLQVLPRPSGEGPGASRIVPCPPRRLNLR